MIQPSQASYENIHRTEPPMRSNVVGRGAVCLRAVQVSQNAEAGRA